jgi:hypothetical protein
LEDLARFVGAEGGVLTMPPPPASPLKPPITNQKKQKGNCNITQNMNTKGIILLATLNQ